MWIISHGAVSGYINGVAAAWRHQIFLPVIASNMRKVAIYEASLINPGSIIQLV